MNPACWLWLMSSWTPVAYKTTHWSDYNTALKQRGSLSIWFDAEMAREAKPSGKRGRQQACSEAAIRGMADDQSAVWFAFASGDRLR